jgi:C4-dicarboxylate transporter DctQ subunit
MVETFTPSDTDDESLPPDNSILFEEAIAIALFVAGTALAGLQVVLRGLFDIGLVWGQEMIVVLIIWSVFLGASAVTARRRHVRMDLIATSVSPALGAALETAAAFAGLLYVVFILIASWRFLFFIQGSHETDPSTDLPMWILFLGMPLGLIIMTLRSAVDLRARFRQFRYLM